jgi:aspartyl-tRNA(Asn)/glutamyl-tRNA(Gln) amidotransferase subunit B
VALIDAGVISGKIAKELFGEMLKTGTSPAKIVESKGLQQISDTSTIEPIVDAILAANPESIEKFKSGKSNLLGFLVGLVMKATQGKADPQRVNDLIRKKIS